MAMSDFGYAQTFLYSSKFAMIIIKSCNLKTISIEVHIKYSQNNINWSSRIPPPTGQGLKMMLIGGLALIEGNEDHSD